ncbi:DUF3299 domain-containing protein [Atopomonas sediminilitoris]|uniref:DUF3299 domain-containing protein n=1 Tax=Atopomonas sediminilitoris TaxID=2919919 RepID=UPI001F4E1794|nr:DUF3299 domain-containing protein [Atopomonas sediminilitoris]MCJ8169468.1 DUF3299 domain-containing protein [Atopomonas sediminilitoris]
MRPLVTLLLLLSLSAPALAEVAELDWLELMPADDRIALENMPSIDHGNVPDRPGDFAAPGGLKQSEGLPAVMYSASTVPALHQQRIRLAGYPVPLDSDSEGRSQSFFLVPYAGACIHVPPPPPNQIILVSFAEGFTVTDINMPIMVEGVLKIESVSDPLADAAYVMDAEQIDLLIDDEQ